MNRGIRNLCIVALFSVGGGWLGIWLNFTVTPALPPMESPGVLLWLTTPAVAGLLLRALGGDGWQDAGLAPRLPVGWKWYIVAIFVYPGAALVAFALAYGVGSVSAEGFATRGFSTYLSAAGVYLGASLIKNVFEEFAWRGYFTPRLHAIGVPPLLNHGIVAVLWWAWHLPYYYYFLDRAVLEAAITTSVPVFLAIGLIVLLPTAILFGELRLISGSTWVVFVLHNVINALSMPLLIDGFLRAHGRFSWVFTPTNEGVITALLLGVAGWWLYRYRTRQAVRAQTHAHDGT